MWTETGIQRRYITDGNEHKIKFISCDKFVPHHQLIIKKGDLLHNFPIDDDYEDEIMIGEITNRGTGRLFNAKMGEWIKIKVDYVSLLIEVKNMTEEEIGKYMIRDFNHYHGGYNNIQ